MFDALTDPKVRAATTTDGLSAGDDGILAPSPSPDAAYLPPVTSFSSSSTTGLQTPHQALRTPYFKINLCVSIVFNILLNLALGYGSLSTSSSEGLWEDPKDPAANTASHIWLDLPGTCFFVTFFTTLVLSPLVKAEVKKGTVAPVAQDELAKGIYRCFPIRVHNPWARALFLALQFLLLWAAPTIIAFGLACSAGWMEGPAPLGSSVRDPVCQVSALWYIWFKSLYAGVTAGFVYPLAMLSALNRQGVPNYFYQCYLQKQYQMQSFATSAPLSGVHAHSHSHSSPLLA